LVRNNVLFSRLKLIIYVNLLSSAFEKSLCFRLQKVFVIYSANQFIICLSYSINRAFCIYTFLNQMNPNTDYHCLKAFGSYFSEDIRIPAVSLYVYSWSTDLGTFEREVLKVNIIAGY
jgi:hypothetical protein